MSPDSGRLTGSGQNGQIPAVLTVSRYASYLLVDPGSDDTGIQSDGCSYCFPLIGGNFKYYESKTYRAVSCDHPGTYTYLHFGPDAQIRGEVQTTPMLPGIPRYYVSMSGICRRYISSGLSVMGTSGFAIDSGSGQSFLALDAYNVVKVEMVRHLMRYGWNPIEGERVPYDLCFRVISAVNQTALPSMTFHFLGAELVVDSNF
ncbi:aspartic proteinase NANA, chloroplast-like [Alnus glutinosa]|uniref:aspartic proteinase NANA, chloroplast-like n=1 Tax=Alnus glutinosa TaxID=3517 RepID=UPI002D767132|nr:aspartic proteinase NANA, chloroplast-like [Alnus glutinosa]